MVRTFSVSTGQRTRELRGHTHAVLTVTLSGLMVASGSLDDKVKVWALTGEKTAECVATLEGHNGGLLGVMGVVAGSDYVASESEEKVIVWRPL